MGRVMVKNSAMDLDAFTASLALPQPPAELSLALQALWWDAKGDWDEAHDCAQRVEEEKDGQWVHAYLHRKQGDPSNAGYWYRRCRRTPAAVPLAEEWEMIARALLEKR